MSMPLEEVKKNDNPAAHDVEVEAPQSLGPLNAYLLAGMADDLADHLADFASELNLHHVQYETESRIMQTYVKWLSSIANQLRKE